MRGAPQSGLARLMVRIRSRTSWETAGPPVLPCGILQVQNNRKPFRCQEMTASGLPITGADFQSAQAPDNHAQKTRSATINVGRFFCGASQYTDLVPQGKILYLEGNARTEERRTFLKGTDTGLSTSGELISSGFRQV